MTNVDYNDLVLKYVEKNVDTILPATAILSLLSAIAIYFSNIPFFFVVVDVLIALTFALLFIFRARISPTNKLIAIFSVGILIGTLSFGDGGFNSGGLTIFMMCNVLAVLMMPPRQGKLISATTFIIFLVFGIFYFTGVYRSGGLVVRHAEWSVHIFMYLLYLIFLHSSVYSIKDYLIRIIKKLEENAQKTYRMAYYDSMTGLPNYDRFLDDVSERLKGGSGVGYIVMFNISNLRIINSVYGDAVGDQVICEATRVINELIKAKDMLARVSGNEFVLWVNNPGDRGIQSEMDYLKKSFYERFSVPEMAKRIEFYHSYVMVGNAIELSAAYKQLVTALAYAKKNKITTFVPYNKDLEAKMIEEEALHEQVKQALEKGAFTQVYQPKIDMLTGETVGVEVLSRWYNEEQGTWISPNVFIPIVEELDLDIPFGEMVISKTFDTYGALTKKYGNDLTVSINISPKQLSSQGFCDFVKDQILASKMKVGHVIFEITEDVLIRGLDKVAEDIKALKHMGIRISLDDFGTGYSSLNNLMFLDIDELKVDRSFVNQLDHRKNQIMLEMIIGLTKAYGLSLVCEGIETKEQSETLKAMGCVVAQGFYYAKPEAL